MKLTQEVIVAAHRTEAERAAPAVVDVEQALALIEKGQQLAGHFPSEEALMRARRVLTGEITIEAARAELRDKWGGHAS